MLTGAAINNHNSNNLETIDVIIEATVAVETVVVVIATRRPRRPSLRRRVVTSRLILRRSIRRDRRRRPMTIVVKGEEAAAVAEVEAAAVVMRSVKRERSLCGSRRVLSISPIVVSNSLQGRNDSNVHRINTTSVRIHHSFMRRPSRECSASGPSLVVTKIYRRSDAIRTVDPSRKTQ
jgi:hypothetical protein